MKAIYLNYLYDIQNLSVGSSVHVQEFVKEFRKFHDIEVYYQNANYEGNQDEKKQTSTTNPLYRKLRKVFVQLKIFIKNIKYIISELEIIKKECPDLIITRYDLLNFSSILLAKIKKIPIILEVNSPHAFESKHYYKHCYHWPILPELVERFNLKNANAVTVVSSELREYFIKQGIEKSKIHVVCNGVDIQKFSPNSSGSAVREKLKVENQIIVGFIGSFHYWHGLGSFLPVIKEILQKQTNVIFLLIGDGVLMNDIQAFIKQNSYNDKVLIPGYLPHNKIASYLSAMDIVVAPYPQIDFFYFSPLKVFEYMSAGKAVVASRLGQISDLIQHNENGLLVEPENLNELEEQLTLLIQNSKLRLQFGNNARVTIEKNYTWYKNAEYISSICEKLVEQDDI